MDILRSSSSHIDFIASNDLLRWYHQHHRKLPWRADIGVQPEPYHVWLSEIMLQQTGVVVVSGYFTRFIQRWPTITDMANADLDDILTQWAGLGYYARARNLHKCAKQIMAEHGGKFPQDIAALLKLPGIGPYTAAAIAAIAFDQPALAMDGNVERVLSRLYAITTPLPDAKPQLRKLGEKLVPQMSAGDFAQAMMDLGATICTPRLAKCDLCPWQSICQASKAENPERYPFKRAKKPRPVRYGRVYWLHNKAGAVLLRRREERGLLGGMMEFPSSTWSEDKSAIDTSPPYPGTFSNSGKVIEHTFTHFHLVLELWQAETPITLTSDENHRWVHSDDFDSLALPSLMRKVAAAQALISERTT